MPKILPLWLAVMALACLDARAKAAFFEEKRLVEYAEAIAVVTISDVKETEVKGGRWTYGQTAQVVVHEVVKGKLPGTFTLHGKEDFICAQCHLAPGRYLAFLKKDGELWTGANWQLSLRPIKGDMVEWYSDQGNTLEQAPASLSKVIAGIRSKLG